MTLTQLSNTDLLGRMTILARTERKITHSVLQCIYEIEKRQLYLANAYPSM